MGRIAYQAEFTVAFKGTADMGLTSAHRNPPFMTRSGGNPGRNPALQQAPDLILANPLSCRPESSALAVFKLITGSYFVGACTGGS